MFRRRRSQRRSTTRRRLRIARMLRELDALIANPARPII
jgi:hypothetical protein